jgi:3-oxoacyl-[acyl-carrier-protein] synthase-3
MDGPTVFKKAIVKIPEVVMESLDANGLKPSDINMLIPHQANCASARLFSRSCSYAMTRYLIIYSATATQQQLPFRLLCVKPGSREKSGMATWFALPHSEAGYMGSALLRW